jgi:hypothetical protein
MKLELNTNTRIFMANPSHYTIYIIYFYITIKQKYLLLEHVFHHLNLVL